MLSKYNKFFDKIKKKDNNENGKDLKLYLEFQSYANKIWEEFSGLNIKRNSKKQFEINNSTVSRFKSVENIKQESLNIKYQKPRLEEIIKTYSMRKKPSNIYF